MCIRDRVCKDCGKEFVWTAGEQEFYASRGFENQPQRCKPFRGDDDFTPFRNIMNEYYARDNSRKIRSTFQSKGKSGKQLTGTVIYGYLWNENRTQWLVDPEAAEVVKRSPQNRNG